MRTGPVWIAALLASALPAPGQVTDPHRVYEESCAACHRAHAGDFVWESLELRGGVLFGRESGSPVGTFLEQGHGGLTSGEIATLMEQFTLIRNSGRVFADKCRICHDSARDLARRELILADGRLTGRYSGRDIEQFLRNHGRLAPPEIGIVVEVLTRALATRETPQ